MTKIHERTDTIYTFIQQYVEIEGIPPTIREIAQGCHCGVRTAHAHLDILEARGLLERRRRVQRGLRLVQRTFIAVLYPPNFDILDIHRALYQKRI